MSNPFLYGTHVAPDALVGREREIRKVRDRLLQHGQSTALIGEPRTGKTSVLHYFCHPVVRPALGEHAGRLIFSYLDGQALPDTDIPGFWRRALAPCRQPECADLREALADAYAACEEQDFDPDSIDALLVRLREVRLTLVLLIDELDAVLHLPTLASATFFGQLRSRASTSSGALALVIASRRSVTQLNAWADSRFGKLGSPFFNILSEVLLSPLSDLAVDHLLARADERFSLDDRAYLKEVCGGHPYFLQVAASELWYADEDGISDVERRRELVVEGLLREAGRTMTDTWDSWREHNPQMQMALTVIALAEMPQLLAGRSFDSDALMLSLRDLSPECRDLRDQGFIVADTAAPSGWRIRPGIVRRWIGGQLVREVREDAPFEDRFRDMERMGLLNRAERRVLFKAFNGITEIIEAGGKHVLKRLLKGG